MIKIRSKLYDFKKIIEKKGYNIDTYNPEDTKVDDSLDLLILARELQKHGDTNIDYLRKMCYFTISIRFANDYEFDTPLPKEFKHIPKSWRYTCQVDLFDKDRNVRKVEDVYREIDFRINQLEKWAENLKEHKKEN